MSRQTRDALIYKGRRHDTYSEPLYTLPVSFPGIKRISWDEAENRYPIIACTAFARGYMAVWKIADGMLFLISVRGIYEMTTPNPIHAGWYNGKIEVPLGAASYTHPMDAFEDEYPQYTNYQFQKGILIKSGGSK